MRAEAEARAWEEHNHKLQEEAKCLIDERLARVVRQDRWLEEKLTEVLEGRLTQAELEIDSEAEEMGEAEESEVVGTEEIGMMGGTQSLAMEVDEEEQDEVVVVEEVKRGEMRKWAPSLLPKLSRKRYKWGVRFRGVQCRGVRWGWGLQGAWGNHAGGVSWPLEGPDATIAK